MRFRFDIDPAQVSANPRHFHASSARRLYQKGLDEMRLSVASERNRRGWPMLEGKVRVIVETHVLDERGVDCDSVLKAALDSLQLGGALKNDRQVSEIVARRIVDGSSRIDVQVEELGG